MAATVTTLVTIFYIDINLKTNPKTLFFICQILNILVITFNIMGKSIKLNIFIYNIYFVINELQ